MKVRIVTGILAGTVGALATGLLENLSHVMGLSHLEILFINDNLLLPEIVVNILSKTGYSFVIHLLIGALIGSVYMYFIPNWTFRHLLYRSFLLSTAAWFIHGNILGNILRLPIKESLPANLIFLFTNIVFGFATVFSGKYFRSAINLNTKDVG